MNDIKASYSGINFNCYADSSQPSLGDHVCAADVDTINGVNSAMFVAFFFSKDALNQVRVSYRGYRHPDVLSSLAQYGRPIVTDRPDINGKRMLMWVIQTGTLAASEDVSRFDESVVLWSSKEAVLRAIKPRAR
jgi:hypothetical protein